MIHNSFQNILFTYLALASGGLYCTSNKTKIAGKSRNQTWHFTLVKIQIVCGRMKTKWKTFGALAVEYISYTKEPDGLKRIYSPFGPTNLHLSCLS